MYLMRTGSNPFLWSDSITVVSGSILNNTISFLKLLSSSRFKKFSLKKEKSCKLRNYYPFNNKLRIVFSHKK